ncbi:hypothetical protein AMTRI_Chr05g72560 [Amborella trichopoda]
MAMLQGPETGEKRAVVAVGVCKSSTSMAAVRWAMENLVNHHDRILLIHVIPVIKAIPTPKGKYIPIAQIQDDVVAMYMQDTKSKSDEIFLPFKRLFKHTQMDTLVLEDDNPSTALLRYVTDHGIANLVLQSSSRTFLMRKWTGEDLPFLVLKTAPSICNIYVVSRNRVISRLAESSKDEELIDTISHSSLQTVQTTTLNKQRKNSWGLCRSASKIFKSYRHSKEKKTCFPCSSEASIFQDHRHQNSIGSMSDMSRESKVVLVVPGNGECQVGSFRTCDGSNCGTEEGLAYSEHGGEVFLNDTALGLQQPGELAEIEKLRKELHNTHALYNRACEDLVIARKKVQVLSIGCSEEAKKIKLAMEREEVAKKVAEEERAKHLLALKEVEVARELQEKEAKARVMAELMAVKESSEREKMEVALLSSDLRYRRYSRDEIVAATDSFSEVHLIGEGGYGKVYKCFLDHTLVAIKVLHQDALEKKEEFLREVEVLSQIHHPHILLLLGACPESGCLVYEYMANGSLEDRLFRRGNTSPLPWYVRFRIIFEVASGLLFLHSSKPDTIVHRDLKPGNILLDNNYVSKIGDVGLAHLISNAVPDSVTEYRDTILVGTLSYMDPEYHRTGTIRPKSDVYAFGIIILQLLTAMHPFGLIELIREAIDKQCFRDMLDEAITDWPMREAEELAQLALKCAQLRCRDRPDLELDILPKLQRIKEMADTYFKLCQHDNGAPSHYLCPILQEVMDNPYIAADGLTYEYRAIKAWLENNNTSPVLQLVLPHSQIIPNYSLRSAIQEWKLKTSLGA